MILIYHNINIFYIGIKKNDNSKISASLSKFDELKIPYRQPKVSSFSS